ncbi:hypothetical protein, partial [uncultured Oscillibacter sp.]|uniref:hypothetical protein n=1 Tax=uncultured Oscillibacter sp. TaxID=876091 RepID=UPI0026075AD5
MFPRFGLVVEGAGTTRLIVWCFRRGRNPPDPLFLLPRFGLVVEGAGTTRLIVWCFRRGRNPPDPLF